MNASYCVPYFQSWTRLVDARTRAANKVHPFSTREKGKGKERRKSSTKSSAPPKPPRRSIQPALPFRGTQPQIKGTQPQNKGAQPHNKGTQPPRGNNFYLVLPLKYMFGFILLCIG